MVRVRCFVAFQPKHTKVTRSYIRVMRTVKSNPICPSSRLVVECYGWPRSFCGSPFISSKSYGGRTWKNYYWSYFVPLNDVKLYDCWSCPQLLHKNLYMTLFPDVSSSQAALADLGAGIRFQEVWPERPTSVHTGSWCVIPATFTWTSDLNIFGTSHGLLGDCSVPAR